MGNTWKTTVHDIVQVDQSTFDFPHNTQWFQNYQGVQEPDKVTPVTYSPEMNPEFDKQNSPGGYPNRFCRKPESEWFSNEGEVNNFLIDMLKNKAAALDDMTRDISKQAELVNIPSDQGQDFVVYINPTFNEVLGLWKHSSSKHLRLLTDETTGDKYIWDAYFATHDDMMKKLTGFRSTLHKDDLDNLSVIRSIFNGSSLKQAGDQSASVPDYLINEWKTEQINNDTDEEPYVNHDQRDYPYGMHDSPENTGTGVGWAKDNTPYVVRLDILENPAYRLDPFGVGEYNVTYYTAMPASDGLEATNPD